MVRMEKILVNVRDGIHLHFVFSKNNQDTLISFFDVFTKLRKAMISFITYVCPSIRPHGMTWLSLHRFSWNFIWVFLKNLSRKFKFHQNMTRIMGTIHEDIRTFMIVSHRILLRMRNVQTKVVKKTKTHFMFNNIFMKIMLFMK